MSKRAESSESAFWGDADDTEARKRYQTLVNAIDDGIYRLDAEATIVAVNDALVELTGCAREELLGEHVSVLFDGEGGSAIEREAHRLRANPAERSAVLELTVRTSEGERVPCGVRVSVLESDGDSGETVGVVRDRPERKEAERIGSEDAQNGERMPVIDRQRMVKALEAAREGISLLGDDGEFVYVNDAYAETFGYSPREMIGEHWEELGIEANPDRFHDEILPNISENGQWMGTTTCVRNDGSTFRSQHSLVSTGDDELICVVRDVTDRDERKRRLEESERRYRTLAEHFPNGIVTLFDHDLTYTLAAGRGFDRIPVDPSDVEGNRLSDVWSEAVVEALDPLLRGALDGEEQSVEVEYAGRDWVVHAVPVTDEQGDVFAGMTMAQDITERKDRERQLDETITELRESEERLKLALEAGEMGTWELDLRTGDAPVRSPQHDRIFGYEEPLDDWSFETFLDHVHPDDREGVTQSFEDAYETGNWEFECRIVRTDGERRWVSAQGEFSYDGDGEPVRAVGIVQDVTDQKERERRLEKSEHRYRTVVENFPNGAVALVDEDLRYAAIGGNPLTDSDLTVDDLKRRPVRDVLSPKLAERLVPGYRAALDGESSTFEYEHEGGDRFTRFHTFPVRDDEGAVFGAMGMSQDITERVEREAELERALDLLERTERIADVGGWEIDPETEDVFWTDHVFALLEVDADEEPPLDEALDMYHEEDQSIVEEAVENALASGDSFDVEVRLRTAGSGEVRWLRLQGVPQTSDGEVVSFRGAAQDVTERKRREQRLEELIDKLEESNERLEQFAYAASHDLQEPLRMVSSYLRLVERRYADELDDDGREFIEFAVDGADRMRDMIEGLLRYSRVDTRGNPFESVDLNAALDDVRSDLRVRIEETDAEITAEELPHIEGDGGQIRQLLQNLLDNAIEYSGDGPPRARVSAERDGNRWKISVTDEGIGIDPDDTDHIFEVFQSLHTPDEHSGTGIGLALCERIVERHGGDIWVESEPGEGSTFTFTLPADGGREQ